MSKTRKPKIEKAEIHEELEGFNIGIDAFGQMVSNTSADKLKEFLDVHAPDKKNVQEEE